MLGRDCIGLLGWLRRSWCIFVSILLFLESGFGLRRKGREGEVASSSDFLFSFVLDFCLLAVAAGLIQIDIQGDDEEEEEGQGEEEVEDEAAQALE